ncbi:MAG: S41 family peptidase [Candidatus Coproplasma sp.]
MSINGRLKTKIKKITVPLAAFALVPIFLLFGCNSEDSAFKWVKSKIDEHYYFPLPQDREYNGSVKEYVNKYLDIYSSFYTAEEYKKVEATSAGSMSGFGVSYEYIPQGVYPNGQSGLYITRVVGNSPASRIGLRAGEFVYSGGYMGEETTFDSYSSFTLFLDSIPQNEMFVLNTDKGAYQTRKKDYTASYCYMATNSVEWNVLYEGNNMTISEESGGKSCLPDGAAYLKLDKFYGNAAQEMAALIEEFNAEKCTSLILDLRQNGGGYVDVMSNISSIFTGQLQNAMPSAGVAQYKNGSKDYFKPTVSFPESKQLPAGVKVSVLADSDSASASEALIGSLICNGVIDYSDVYISDYEDGYLNHHATVANCRTYGKGIMQSTYRHPIYGYAIKLTTALIYWPDNTTTIHGTGLGAEMGCKTVKASWNVTYDDEQLSLAVQQIYGLSN